MVEGAGGGPLGDAVVAEEAESEGGEDAVGGAEEEGEVGGEEAGVEGGSGVAEVGEEDEKEGGAEVEEREAEEKEDGVEHRGGFSGFFASFRIGFWGVWLGDARRISMLRTVERCI